MNHVFRAGLFDVLKLWPGYTQPSMLKKEKVCTANNHFKLLNLSLYKIPLTPQQLSFPLCFIGVFRWNLIVVFNHWPLLFMPI